MKQLSHLPSTITSTRVDAAVCVSQPRLLRMLGSLALLALLLAWSNVASAQSVAKVSKGTSAASSLVFEVEGPQNAQVSATPVVRTSPNGKRLYGAYDINVSKDGREWQPAPEQPALVTMTASNLVDGKFYDVYHEGKDGLELVATVMPENGHITFPAHSFSVYIVAESGNYARLKVTFHRADNSTVTIYVKPADLDQGFFDRIVYNPGVGTVPSGQQFRGWIANASYTAANASQGLTFAMVRDSIRNRLAAGVTDGTELHFYAMLFKSYTVSYLDENTAVINTGQVLFRADESTDRNYTVNAAYTPPDNTKKFEGWKVRDGGSNISPYEANRTYTNGTSITIRGNVVFEVDVSEGHWLVFDENGKGATYNAPQFVPSGGVTSRPVPDNEMTRFGYGFGGWYTNQACTNGNEFTFGRELAENITIYAKWIANTTANYTVIIWKQNVDGTGYDFDTVISNLTGNVGSIINTVTQQGTGNNAYARVNGTDKQYTGFHLNRFDQNVTINTEGNAVVNVYYDRNQYTLNFQIEGQGNHYSIIWPNDDGRYYIPDGNGGYTQVQLYYYNGTLYRNRNWVGGWLSGHYEYSNPYDGLVYTKSRWQDIKVITALFEQYIGDQFPIVGTNGVTYNNGERWDPQRNQAANGANDVIVYIDIIPDYDETYKLNTANRPLKTMNWYVEALPEDENTVTAPNRLYNYQNQQITAPAGKTYVLHNSIGARYNGATIEDFIELLGYDKIGSDSQRNGQGYYIYDERNDGTINFYYSRKTYTINFMHGSYYDGNNNRTDASGQITTQSGIAYGADISDRNDFEPSTIPAGYVFEGWYADKLCTHAYTFTTMPKGGVTVYAKWRLKQYRVFLHPNAEDGAGNDISDLSWGSSTQGMNFRVSYGERISAPTGYSDNYEFVGWYTDPACTDPFNSDITLNDGNTVTYDKTTELTDSMNIWGNIVRPPQADYEPYNSDASRKWVAKKYELYGKWRAKLRGAIGITVVYDANGGTCPVATDPYKYQDNVNAVASSACTHPDENKEFAYWVMQHYDEGNDAFEDIVGSCIFPGAPFSVRKVNAKTESTQWYNPNNPNDYVNSASLTAPDATHTAYRATYTVRLRAEYVDIEQPTYTFIIWYKNDGNGTVVRTDGTGRDNPSLGINVTTDPPTPSIPAAPSRDGYTFKGWYKKNISGSTIPDTVKQCTPNFLYYNSENSKYYKEAGFTNEVTKVAADIYQPDDYLYAIWEPVVDFSIPGICRGQHITLPTRADLPGAWSATSGTFVGTDYLLPEASSVSSVTFTFTPDPSSYPSSCASAKNITVTVNQLDAEIVVDNP